MATQYGTTGNDILVVTAGNTYRGLDGDDIYMVSSALVPTGANVVFSDTVGNNKVQFIDGLTIASSVFYADEVTLTLSNGATINIVGADKFGFYQGGNAITGDLPTVQTFAEFAADLGVPTLPTGTGTANGAGDYEVGEPPVPPTPTFSLQGSATVAEGGNATYTVTLSSAPAADVTVNYATAYAGGASAADITGTGAGTLTFTAANWNTPQTITIPVVQDTNVESGEKIAVSLLGNSAGTAIDDTKKLVSTSLTEVPVAFTFTGSAEVYEAQTATYTVVANRPVDADTTVSFSVVAGDNLGADQGTGNTNLNDFAGGAFNPFAVKILKGETTATYTVAASDDAKTELPETFLVKAAITGQTLDNVSTTLLDGLGATAGQTFTLTSGVDTVGGTGGMKGSGGTTGTDGDDKIKGTIETTSTWSALDNVDAGDGVDEFVITAINDFAIPGGTKVTDVETVTIAAAAKFGTYADNTAAAVDLSTLFSGVSTLQISGGTEFDAKAPSSAAVTLTDSAGGIELYGGASQTVNLSAQGGQAEFADAAGAVSVTSSKQATFDIIVDGGTTVNVTGSIAATTAAVPGGDITVGGATPATGAVTIVQNLTSNGGDADTDDLTAAAITVDGGSTVSITVNATSTAQNSTADGDIVIGDITVTGDGKTTSIIIDQNATVTTSTKATVADKNETSVVTFSAMTAGQTVEIATAVDGTGLVFTAAKDLTKEQVAQAFSNLTVTDTQTSGGPTANGIFTGALPAGWTSGAASGAVVTFTAIDDDQSDLDLNDGTATAPTSVNTAGTNGTAAVTSSNTVTYGKVVIDDAAAEAITSITVDGYLTGSTVGATTPTEALSTLNLARAGADATMVIADTASTVALTLESMGISTDTDEAAVTFTAAPTTLNVTAIGNNYVDLTAAATTALTVAGTGLLNVADVDLAALATVSVTGSASLVLPGLASNTLTSVTSSGTTGSVTASIDGTAATYTGGAGVDTVTLLTGTSLTKAIDLGKGDDTLTFGAAITTSSATLSGGDGTDTLSMDAARAVALDDAAQTFYTSFERLTINSAVGTDDATANAVVTINLANLGFTNYVTSNGTVLDTTAAADSDFLVLDNLASGGTVVMVAAAAGANTNQTVQIKDAATGTADVLNLTARVGGVDINYGLLTAANTETVNLTADDTNLDEDGDGVTGEAGDVDTVTLTLTADKATALNLGSSDANLTLTLTGSNSLTAINAGSMTGALTVNVNTTAAVTVTAGSGADVLTATGSQDVLLGGAGNDILTGADLTTLTGGAGNDEFVVNIPTNVNSYSTITDASSGDVIQLTAGETFVSSAIVLADTAVFQDYANATANKLATDDKDAAWFQYQGHTYIIVNDAQADATDANFENGSDAIIKLTGLVNLAAASYNETDGTLEIA